MGVSIMEPMRGNKRALSVPPARRQIAQRIDLTRPDPWHALGPLGEKATRTATALAELAVQTAHLGEPGITSNG